MHIISYNSIYPALLEDFNAVEFIVIKKSKKKLKMLKSALAASYAMLASAACFGSTEVGFAMIVASLILIFYFQNRIKRCFEVILQDNSSIEFNMKSYINSQELDDFRDLQLEKVKNGKISKNEYLELIKEDALLHLALIKKDCAEGTSIDVASYKCSIVKLFANAYNAVGYSEIEEEEIQIIEKKWVSDLQVLRNQYANTDLEVEIKYLFVKSGAFK